MKNLTKLDKHNDILRHVYTHFQDFCIASRISRFRLQYHSIVIINSNLGAPTPQHQHTTMDGNKIVAILLHQLNSNPAFHVKPSLVSLVALSLLLPPMSQFLIAHSNTTLIFQSSNHSLSLSLSCHSNTTLIFQSSNHSLSLSLSLSHATQI